MTLYTNASDFIPLTTIPLTDLAVCQATGPAEIRWKAQEKREQLFLRLHDA